MCPYTLPKLENGNQSTEPQLSMSLNSVFKCCISHPVFVLALTISTSVHASQSVRTAPTSGSVAGIKKSCLCLPNCRCSQNVFSAVYFYQICHPGNKEGIFFYFVSKLQIFCSWSEETTCLRVKPYHVLLFPFDRKKWSCQETSFLQRNCAQEPWIYTRTLQWNARICTSVPTPLLLWSADFYSIRIHSNVNTHQTPLNESVVLILLYSVALLWILMTVCYFKQHDKNLLK